jgi:hypothetical protein
MTYARFRSRAIRLAWKFRGSPRSDWRPRSIGRSQRRCSGS